MEILPSGFFSIYLQESPDGEQKMLAISHVKTIFMILPSGYGWWFAMVFRWPIEIDGLPNYKMVIFHGELLNNQMVFVLFNVNHLEV